MHMRMIILEKTANRSFWLMWHWVFFFFTLNNRFGLLSFLTFLSLWSRRNIGVRCVWTLLIVVAFSIRIRIWLWTLLILFLFFLFVDILGIFECSFHVAAYFLATTLNFLGIVDLVLDHLIMITLPFYFCNLFVFLLLLFAHLLP